MSETGQTNSGLKRILTELRRTLFGCLYRKRVSTPLAKQDASIQQLQQNYNTVNEKLDQLVNLNLSNDDTGLFNVVSTNNEVKYLTERVTRLEQALAEQKSLFEKLISDFTRLEETHWCNISSVHSDDSPKLVLPDTPTRTSSMKSTKSDSDTSVSSHHSSELSEDLEASDNDSIDSSDIETELPTGN